MSPATTHVSDISYKAYMGKTVICRTFTMNTIIIVLYLYKVVMHVYVHMYVQECLRSQNSPKYMSIKYLLMSVWHDLFLERGAYHLHYKHLAMALSMIVTLHSYLALCAELSSRPSPQLYVAYNYVTVFAKTLHVCMQNFCLFFKV